MYTAMKALRRSPGSFRDRVIEVDRSREPPAHGDVGPAREVAAQPRVPAGLPLLVPAFVGHGPAQASEHLHRGIGRVVRTAACTGEIAVLNEVVRRRRTLSSRRDPLDSALQSLDERRVDEIEFVAGERFAPRDRFAA
jgi:hypothetical protein